MWAERDSLPRLLASQYKFQIPFYSAKRFAFRVILNNMRATRARDLLPRLLASQHKFQIPFLSIQSKNTLTGYFSDWVGREGFEPP